MEPKIILILLSVFYVIAGACNAIFIKNIVSQESLGLPFSHGWFLNLIMFIGESMGIPVYYILFYKKEKEENLKNKELPGSVENKISQEEGKNQEGEENKALKEENQNKGEEIAIKEEEKKNNEEEEENKTNKEENKTNIEEIKINEEDNKNLEEEKKEENKTSEEENKNKEEIEIDINKEENKKEEENKSSEEENKNNEEEIIINKEENKNEEKKNKNEEEENKNKEEEEKKNNEEEEKPEINKFLLAIPGFTDTCSTGIANIGLILLPASIYQMLKGSLIVMTFLMSKFVVKNKHILDHYIAIPISTLGVFLVGLSAYLNADDKENDEHSSSASQTLLGIILMLLSMFILSIQFIFDEYFMRKYKCHPLICIGYEGVFGFFINLFLCITFSFIKCANYGKDEKPSYFVENICTEDDKRNWYPENLIFAFRQLFHNNVLIIIVPTVIIFMSSFNILGVSITKYGSATTRSVTDNVRSFLVWLWFLMPFNNKKLIEHFSFLQLFGFLCICLGAFVYNGLFKLEERKNKRKTINLDDEFKENGETAQLIDS